MSPVAEAVETSPDVLADLEWAREQFLARSKYYDLHRRYYDGKHDQVFEIASETHERYFRALLERIKENLCKSVVRAPAERFSVESWSEMERDESQIFEQELGLRPLMNRTHTEALKTGDAYVLVWPDDAPQMWLNRAESIVMRYSEGEPTVAAKLMIERQNSARKSVRLNLYYPDRLERFSADVTSGEAIPRADRFKPWADETGEAVIRHSFGRVPVVRFANDLGEEDERGTSINEDAVPLQDLLNKTLADMAICSEFFALPMRAFTGVQDEVDPESGKSQADEFNARRDRFLFFGGSDTKAWSLPAGDVKQIAEITDSIALKVARVTGTPLHYLVLGQGNFPSGEALRTAEGRLIARVSDLQDDWGARWTDVLALAGQPDMTPTWADPARVTETERLDRLEKKMELGVPWHQRMLDLGYTESDIARMETWKTEEKEAAADAAARAFDAGV